MSTTMTRTPWTDAYRERPVAPVAALRAMGEVCPKHVGGAAPSAQDGFGGFGSVVIDDRFTGTRAWSPPGC